MGKVIGANEILHYGSMVSGSPRRPRAVAAFHQSKPTTSVWFIEADRPQRDAQARAVYAVNRTCPGGPRTTNHNKGNSS